MSQLHEVTFNWPYNAYNVVVTGTFDNWSLSIPLVRTESGFSVKVPVPWGEKVTYKYVVDGHWVTSSDHPTEYDPIGNLNNIYFAPPKPTPATIVTPLTPESVKEIPLPEEDEVVAPTTVETAEPAEAIEAPLPETDETLTNPEPTPAETADPVSPKSAVSVDVEEVEEQTPPAVEKNESALELTVEPESITDDQAPAPEAAAEEEVKPEPVYLAGAVQSPTEAEAEAAVEAPTEPEATPAPAPEAVAADHDSTAPTDAATTVVVPSTESTKESAPSTRPSTPPKASFPLNAPDSPSNKATPPATPKSTVSKATNGKDSMRKKRGSIFGKIMGVFSSPKKDA